MCSASCIVSIVCVVSSRFPSCRILDVSTGSLNVLPPSWNPSISGFVCISFLIWSIIWFIGFLYSIVIVFDVCSGSRLGVPFSNIGFHCSSSVVMLLTVFGNNSSFTL